MSISFKFLAGGTALLGAAVAAAVAAGGGPARNGQNALTGPNGRIDAATQTGGSGRARALTPKFMVGEMQSLTSASFPYGTETFITILNDDVVAHDVRVDWLYEFGAADNLAGTSGPATIPPGTQWRFTTRNSADSLTDGLFEDWSGFISFRDTTADISGRAKILIDPGDSFDGIGVSAIRIGGYATEGGGEMAHTYKDLKVFRIKEGSGLARQAGD